MFSVLGQTVVQGAMVGLGTLDLGPWVAFMKALGVLPGPEPTSDATLVARAAAGGRRAFEELYRRHVGTVFRRMTIILGPDPDREDLVQEVFTKTFRAIGGFRGDAELSTYLHRAAVNRAYDHLRSRRRKPLDLVPVDQLDVAAGAAASPEAVARERQQVARLLGCLERIKPKKRVALALVAFEGLTLAQAAELLDAKEDAVRQRVKAARAELAALLEEK
jgi:RNA polymerase sigma-70 factor (ECF subfamily)